MKGCKSCKYNQPRTLENKACLKRHMAIFGFGCHDFEELNEIEPNEPDYEIGYQVTIYDILEDEQERDE